MAHVLTCIMHDRTTTWPEHHTEFSTTCTTGLYLTISRMHKTAAVDPAPHTTKTEPNRRSLARSLDRFSMWTICLLHVLRTLNTESSDIECENTSRPSHGLSVRECLRPPNSLLTRPNSLLTRPNSLLTRPNSLLTRTHS